MTYTFKEYVLNWWEDYIEDADEATAKRIMENEFIGEEETVDDYIPEDAENCKEWLLMQSDAEQIYKTFFGSEATDNLYDNLPDTETFLKEMFMNCANWYDNPNNTSKPSFAEDFVSDMAYHAQDYEMPLGFFEDLQHGCISGMIGMLIYNHDCKQIYIEHMDDMEEYKEELEEGLGEPIANRHHVPHYTFLCWLCYEELGFQIARTLYPDA